MTDYSAQIKKMIDARMDAAVQEQLDALTPKPPTEVDSSNFERKAKEVGYAVSRWTIQEIAKALTDDAEIRAAVIDSLRREHPSLANIAPELAKTALAAASTEVAATKVL